MKRSPEYYRNRKRLKNLTYDTDNFNTTIDDIHIWFDILNEQLFGNKLQPFGKISLKRHKNVHALFHYWPRKENKPTMLEINRKFENKKFFVEILAHEMVHLFQYQYNEPLGHGPSFFVWSDNFYLKGLKLQKAS
jgi:hypothetical protein